jgi:inorganic triphosphatase YgiF
VAKARNKASAHRESIETKLKLAFPPEAASRLADYLALKSPRARALQSQRLVSTYYDTPSCEPQSAS